MPSKTGPNILVARKQGLAALLKRVMGTSKLAAYVGIPAASTRTRSEQLLGMAVATRGKNKKTKLQKAAESDVTNAELLFIHTNGSPVRHIPARPVLQPAVQLPENAKIIGREIAASCKDSIAGDHTMAVKKMQRAALAGQTVARKFFTDSRNGWAPNAPSTIAAKGSDRPLIDTGALRAAIVGVVSEE